MVTNKGTQRIDKNPSDGVCAIGETAGFKPDMHPPTRPFDSARAKRFINGLHDVPISVHPLCAVGLLVR